MTFTTVSVDSHHASGKSLPARSPGASAESTESGADGEGSPVIRPAARLGMLVGGERLLVELAEAGEILPLPPLIVPVPLTREWFLGMTNVRGSLYTVVDLRRFSGRSMTEVGKESRLLSLAPSLGFNVTLIVSRMLGLRNTSSMTQVVDPQTAPPPVPWIGNAFADADGDIWLELSLSRLIAAPEFLMVGR